MYLAKIKRKMAMREIKEEWLLIEELARILRRHLPFIKIADKRGLSQSSFNLLSDVLRFLMNINAAL